MFINLLTHKEENRMRIEILIGGVQVKALIDTGAERSVLCVETFRKIQRSKANSLVNDVILLTVSGKEIADVR